MFRFTGVLGARVGELQAVKDEVARLIQASWKLHDSLYHGGDYWLGEAVGDNARVIIETNLDLMDEGDAPNHLEWPDHMVIVFLNDVLVPDDFLAAIGKVGNSLELLRAADRPSSPGLQG